MDNDINEENFITVVRSTTVSITGNIVLDPDMELINHIKVNNNKQTNKKQ